MCRFFDERQIETNSLLHPWKRGDILIGWLVGDVIAPLILSSIVPPGGEKQPPRPLKTSNTAPSPSRRICKNSWKKRAALCSLYRVSEPATAIFSILNANTMTPCGTSQTKVFDGTLWANQNPPFNITWCTSPDWWPFIFTSKWKYANTLLNSS